MLRSLVSARFVTGVTWIEGANGAGELWHATWKNDASELRRIGAATGEVLESLEMPEGVNVSGLEADGKETFYCGGGNSRKLRIIRRLR